MARSSERQAHRESGSPAKYARACGRLLSAEFARQCWTSHLRRVPRGRENCRPTNESSTQRLALRLDPMRKAGRANAPDDFAPAADLRQSRYPYWSSALVLDLVHRRDSSAERDTRMVVHEATVFLCGVHARTSALTINSSASAQWRYQGSPHPSYRDETDAHSNSPRILTVKLTVDFWSRGKDCQSA